MKLLVVLLLVVAIFIAGCAAEDRGIKKVSPAEFKEIISKEEVFVIDVHIPEQEHIAGTDAVIPFDELEKYQDQLPSDKDTPLALYCRSGSMSAAAAQELADRGYTEVYDLQGGRNAYMKELGG